MKSPHEPDGHRDEDVPSDVAEVFRPPPHRLEPPAGAYETLRRRAAGRRRRRALTLVAATACCAAAGVLGTYAAQSGSDVVRTRDVADAPHPSGRTAAPKGEQQSRGPSGPAPGRPTAQPPAFPHGTQKPADPPATTPAAPPPPAHTRRTAVSGCTAAQLQLTAGRGDAAAGSVHVPLLFTNTGAHTCSMHGFPGVSIVGTGGAQIGAAAGRTGTGADGASVLLAPGHTARADVRVTRAQNYPQERCEPAPAAGLRVYPPGETQALFLPRAQLTGCQNTGVGLLSVKPVRSAS